tara:strand:- start:113 stop:1045 length:933 start_codon:yes stop_codon:yes gene_type:complete
MNLSEKKTCIIIPCYNEEKNLNDLLKRIKNVLNELNTLYKIILIDDGSTDNTWSIITNFSTNDKNITGIKFSRNFGQEYALKVGFDNAEGDYIFSMDADLQDPPELLKEMLMKLIKDNLNIVYAQRSKNNEKFFKKQSSIFFYYVFNKICKIKIPKQVSDFRLIDKKVLTQLKKINESDMFYRGLIPWTGFKSDHVTFERKNRMYGETGMTIKSMLNHALIGIFNFSTFPMKLSFFIASFMILIFLSLSIYAFYSYMTDNIIKGWTSIMMVICFFNIAIFFILGLISEYVGRIYKEVKNRPRYIIDKKIN